MQAIVKRVLDVIDKPQATDDEHGKEEKTRADRKRPMQPTKL